MLFTNETIEQLYKTGNTDDANLQALLSCGAHDEELFACADKKRRQVYGDSVYVRGLIEFSNHCKNNCYYCGIRAGNTCAARYRLSKEEILECCREGYDLGIRSFVLQSGEDPYFDDELLCDIVSAMHSSFPDCAIVLSVGEKNKASYKAYYEAGARRYLLRHEAASDALYRKLHPNSMALSRRKQCLYDLKSIGYQVGAGLMIGAPHQTIKDLIEDLHFLKELDPDMIGVGPFLRHRQTPFAQFENGSIHLTLRFLAILRLMFPHALIPATTALASVSPTGREQGLKAGANVVMPNLSPVSVRKLYDLYENKNCTGAESAQCSQLLYTLIENAGYHAVTDIGDVKRPL